MREFSALDYSDESNATTLATFIFGYIIREDEEIREFGMVVWEDERMNES